MPWKGYCKNNYLLINELGRVMKYVTINLTKEMKKIYNENYKHFWKELKI